MRIYLNMSIDLIKVKKAEVNKAFDIASKYIEKSSLMTVNRDLFNEGLYVLDKAQIVNIHNSTEKVLGYDIIGDYITKSKCENYRIYKEFENFLRFFIHIKLRYFSKNVINS